MVLRGSLTEWLTLLVLVAGPGAVATVLWSAVLAVGRLRALFDALPLTRWTAANYLLVSMVLSVPWVLGLGWAFARLGGGDPGGGPLLDVAVQLTGLYLLALPVAAGAGLPHLGVDWDPAGYGATTWVILVAASAWYALVFALPTFLFALIVSLPT
jgi:hypothetical protein